MMDSKTTLNLVVIGPKHAGKTVYLTTLANSPKVSLSDPATIDLVSIHWETMQQGSLLPATAGTISTLNFSYHCEINSQEYNIDFTVPDYDGHFAETLSKGDINSPDIVRLRHIIAEADGFIVFMPMGGEDERTMERMRYEIGSFVNILREVFDKNSKIPVPLIVAVNKWDKSPDFKKENEDVEALKYIQSVEIYKTLYERLQNYFSNITVLPISAYGHHTEEATPVAGKLAPYRVTEPLMVVVQDFFANLKNTLQKLKDNAPALAEMLLFSKPLWKRLPDEDYDGLLHETLDLCYQQLSGQLSQAHNRKEFDKILHEAPQASLIPDFTPTQQLKLEHMAKPHRDREKRKYIKYGTIAAAVLLITGFVWYTIDLNLNIKRGWQEVVNAETQKQPALLANFIDKYSANAMSRMLASEELGQAQEKLQRAVFHLQEIIDGRLVAFDTYQDSCKIADEARQLIDMSREMSQAISNHSMTKLQAFFQTSNDICKAKTDIESAIDDAALHQAVALLANKPESEEVIKIKRQANEKSQIFARQLAEAQENDRIAPILLEFQDLANGDMNGAIDFIRKYERDANPDVQQLTVRIKADLPEFFYKDLMEKINSVRDFKSQEFAELSKFVRENIQDVPLEERHIATIREQLQGLAENIDRTAISQLPDHISTVKELEDSLALVNQLKADRLITLDGGLYEYAMPSTLADQWNRKIDILNSYLNAINTGVMANWILIARSNNRVKLDCQNLMARDAQLYITFSSSSLPDQSPQKGKVQCQRLDGDRGYEFYYNGRVNQFSGTVTLTKDRYMRSPLSCQAYVNVNAQDLINLYNGQRVDISLQNNCPGTSLRFIRDGR